MAEKMGVTVDISPEEKEKGYTLLNLRGSQLGMLIGRRGQTLDALQYLTNIVANKETRGLTRASSSTPKTTVSDVRKRWKNWRIALWIK